MSPDPTTGSAPRALAIVVRSDDGLVALRSAAGTAGLQVVELSGDPREAVALRQPDVAFRAPGGYLAAVLQLGGDLTLAGATPEWFCSLAPEVTGRAWQLVTPDEARALVRRASRLVKLADGKHRGLPARRYRDDSDLSDALHLVHAGTRTKLMTTDTWLDLHSEYRVFTVGREPLAWSPYLVEDDPFTPLLRWHHASFHDEAAAFVETVLSSLAEDDVPPTAVLDVARLADGRFVLLEANSPWSAGLYGCDADGALRAVLTANDPSSVGEDDRWRWRPDESVFDVRWADLPPEDPARS